MAGRVRRKALAAVPTSPPPLPGTCAICERPLGQRVEWHHLVPRSAGGREMVPLHPICHRAIHASFPNADLARRYRTMEALLGQSAIARFVAWIADKPPDFTAPTHRARLKART